MNRILPFLQTQLGRSIAKQLWANAQRDGRPVEYRWRPVLNAANFVPNTPYSRTHWLQDLGSHTAAWV